MKERTLSIIFSILIAGGAFGGYRVIEDTSASLFENSVHEVVRVIDGDTLMFEDEVRVRLLGIDTPERGECFYEESKKYVEDLIEGEVVRIEKDISGSDRVGRLLRYVYVPSDSPEEDDLFLQDHLVREGYANILPVAPDNRYRDLLSSAREEARTKGKGLWSACDVPVDDSLRENDAEPINTACTIKGNVSEKGYGKQYFSEGCPNYNRIKIDVRKGEAYFCTQEEAEAAGFSRSESCDNSF